MYRMTSEIAPQVNLRLKIEINTREHFNVLGLVRWPFEVPSRWFSGSCELATYKLNELIGTKLRALYQRRKGRDLFDLWYAVTRGNAEPHRIVEIFQKYISASEDDDTSEIVLLLAESNEKAGQYNKAIELYRKVIKSNNRLRAQYAYASIGHLYSKLEKKTRVKKTWEKYLKEYPEGVFKKEALLELGKIKD